jgi:hypothetical protein
VLLSQGKKDLHGNAEIRRASISFILEEVGEVEEKDLIERRPSMMTLKNTMRNKMRSFSEISIIDIRRDQSLRDLGILIVSVILFIIFMYCFNWLDVYLFFFEFFK